MGALVLETWWTQLYMSRHCSPGTTQFPHSMEQSSVEFGRGWACIQAAYSTQHFSFDQFLLVPKPGSSVACRVRLLASCCQPEVVFHIPVAHRCANLGRA